MVDAIGAGCFVEVECRRVGRGAVGARLSYEAPNDDIQRRRGECVGVRAFPKAAGSLA